MAQVAAETTGPAKSRWTGAELSVCQAQFGALAYTQSVYHRIPQRQDLSFCPHLSICLGSFKRKLPEKASFRSEHSAD